MSSLLTLAKDFEEKSKQQASNTGATLKAVFSEHEKSVTEALSSSEQKIRDATARHLREMETLMGEHQKKTSRLMISSWRYLTAFLLLVALSCLAGVWYTFHSIQTNRETIHQQKLDISRQEQTLDDLAKKGGKLQVIQCGDEKRLCVKVDTSTPEFGENGEYRIAAGY